MIIDKIAVKVDNYKKNEYFYDSAREGMYDILSNMLKTGMINTLLLPAYIGWSPKEGSGIFDPINKLSELSVHYYKMNDNLEINMDDLEKRVSDCKPGKFAVLIVNYFGFIDSRINKISEFIKKHSGWIIEDNAHGFFTYHNIQKYFSDASFFSLHKMFPFKSGGSVVIHNSSLKTFDYSGICIKDVKTNPWQYDIKAIINKRRENYNLLYDIIKNENCSSYFIPLRGHLDDNVPQTFPIRILSGDRNKIYDLMNTEGFGVVSLYHTLIEALNEPEYQVSCMLSKQIMNLPVHQDVDSTKYQYMIKFLIRSCELTANK
jgi:dTDP-4-amino-4,6-dideoxygalactose transaminase